METLGMCEDEGENSAFTEQEIAHPAGEPPGPRRWKAMAQQNKGRAEVQKVRGPKGMLREA